MAWSSNPVDGKYVSFSSVELYNTCPFKYEQQYIYKKFGPKNIFVVIGITLHEIVEGAFSTGCFDLEYWATKVKTMLREVCEKEMPSLLTVTGKGEYMMCYNSVFDLMEKTFQLLKKNRLAVQIPTSQIELKLKGKCLGWKIGGKSDLILPDPNPSFAGWNVLFDIKSSKSESEVHHYQTLLYREMVPKELKVKRVGVLYPALGKLVISKEEYRMKAAEYLKTAIKGLEKREFSPMRNKYCQYCHLKEPCPIYKCRPRKK